MSKKKIEKKVEEDTNVINSDIEKEKKVALNTKNAQRDIFMSYMPYLIIIFFVVIIRIFIATPVRVNGSSMYPNLQNKDVMILYKLTKHTRGIRRFDIVVIETDNGKLIKRVIGLPGEKISYKIEKDEDDNDIGVLYINDKKVNEDFITEKVKTQTCHEGWELCNKEITIGEDEYFVMGDNRINSKDSRMIGTVTKEEIMGTTELTIWPLSRLGKKE